MTTRNGMERPIQIKITLIGGGGMRTPLLVDALARSSSELGLTEVALYDVDRSRCEQMAALCKAVVDSRDSHLDIKVYGSFEPAVRSARFVITSIRVGGIAARARDERLLVDRGADKDGTLYAEVQTR